MKQKSLFYSTAT